MEYGEVVWKNYSENDGVAGYVLWREDRPEDLSQ